MKIIYKFLIKNLLCISLFLILAIICKSNIDYKNNIYKSLYQDNFDFSNIRFFYNKYLGGTFPIENIYNVRNLSVFDEKLVYHEISPYEEGAILKVDYNYLVPAIDSGLVVYIGKKEKYGNVIIVEGGENVDIWYGNLCNIMFNLYDSIKKGDYIGEVCNNSLYVIYTEKNKFLNYRDYLE